MMSLRKTTIAATASLLLVSGCVTDAQNNPNKTMGTLLGAGLGALAGSQIGGGKGNMAAIAVGTLAGAWLGGNVGSKLDEVDRMKMQGTTQSALEYNKAGTTSSWSNPDSGHEGTITPTRTYSSSAKEDCREYRTTVTIDGRVEEAYGTACRQPDGSWQVIN
ncbi:RT0821/Lpp0805 family surface protein [Magnetospira sp. QH-2]|uniref:RT0821/Lpp0805 family surface protein n=1 Tax=Magnetospira sp. (strain QH-2) TaxID=1288970 RepID=UPI0003E80BD7|nr:RT0821/Lpp0805 family surface protein [Magnetospira sp. QH-2]CCQ73991.1 17 kDa surface antigen [Magnetospira sp. QH-2]